MAPSVCYSVSVRMAPPVIQPTAAVTVRQDGWDKSVTNVSTHVLKKYMRT